MSEDNIYKMRLVTPSYLCDVDDRLHVWAAIRLCQEVTEYHGNTTGIGFERLKSEGRAWVITQALYEVVRLPMAFEEVELQTWSRGNNGLMAFRDYRMVGKAGEVLLRGTSSWVLIDLGTRRVVRLGNVVVGYPNHAELATGKETLEKLRLPEIPEGMKVGEMRKEVVCSMLDHTRHVNNSEYVRLIFDQLQGAGFNTGNPFSLEVGYAHESVLGDELRLTCWNDGPVYWAKVHNGRGESVVGRVA